MAIVRDALRRKVPFGPLVILCNVVSTATENASFQSYLSLCNVVS